MPAVLVQRQWRYDRAGRVTQSDDGRWGTSTYRHDLAGQIAEMSRGALREVFEHDPAGSLVRALRGLGASGEQRWKVAPGNLLLKTGEASYAHDPRGRRVGKLAAIAGSPGQEALTEYVWDCRDRLREVKLPGGGRVALTYDALGRRVRKEVFRADGVLARSTHLLWDGDALCAELDSERGPRSFVHRPGTLEPLLQEERGEVLTYVNDHLGMPRELIDTSGRVAWAAAHTAFGEVVETYADPSRSRAVDSPFRLLGQVADDDTGLCWTRYRCFDPAVGRWLSPDPLGNEGGSNLLGWNGSPVVEVDPLGLNAAAGLPRMQGMSVPQAEQTLTGAGFNRTNPANPKNQKWKHPDGSEVRIHAYGNQNPCPYKSGNNAHVHKEDPSGNQLHDRGHVSTNPDETHIGLKNRPDHPTVAGRPHGS